MVTQSKHIAALSRIFSSTVIKELATRGQSAALTRLLRDAVLTTSVAPRGRVRDAFDWAFELLKQAGLRDEYVYKAALTHRVLMGRHSLRTAAMLREFRVENCKADIAILNGTTTAYEIKSERDSLSRLERQVDAYRKVFASVFVIAGEKHVDEVLAATPADVGVMCLSSRYSIQTRREAKDCPNRIAPVAVFESVRTNEACAIVAELGHQVPDVPNTRLRTALREQFETLAPAAVHGAMLTVLKRTRDLQPLSGLVERLPLSLHAAALSVPLRSKDHNRLVSAVDTPLARALCWT